MSDLMAAVKAYDVRGIVPDEIDESACGALGAAFVDVVGAARSRGRVVVGHDMRPSSPDLSAAFARGAATRGADVVLIGLCSTDGLYHASGSLDSPGAMFTASHNPAQYNGIKMCHAGARPLGQEGGLVAVRDRARQFLANGVIGAADVPGRLRRRDMLPEYARFLRDLVDLADSRPLRVVVDAGNGMAGHTAPAVLGTQAGLPPLPLDVVPLYFELDGTFPNHEANPLDPANLVDLQAAVVAEGADLGLAFDGDADRCFVVDETGAAVDPSAVTALVAEREIAKELAAGRTPTVIYNLISSRAVPETVTAAGGRAVRTRVGHSFIKAEMADHGAVFGGEHSAHYYFRDFWFADTGMLAALHVLAALAESPGPLSALMARHSRYVSSGELNTTVDDAPTAARTVAQRFSTRPGAATDDLDGLTVTHEADADGPLWWFNLRSSNTEPLLRLNVEAADAPTMERVRDEVLAMIRP